MPKTINRILLPILVIIALYLSVVGFHSIKYPDMDCENKNTIIQEYTYESKEYQLELIRLLKESDFDKTRFWFGEYIDPTHVTIRIQNENICAKGLITVLELGNESGFMSHLMSAKGKSYGGDLLGVKLDFDTDVLNPEIILISVDSIVD